VKLSNTFVDLWSILAVTTTISSIFYFVFIQFQSPDLKVFFWAQGIALFTTCFDISWFFQGIEDFKKISIRNIIIKTLTIISIFSFVNDKDDLVLYIVILVGGNALGQIIMWKYLLNHISLKLYKYDFNRIKLHLLRNLKMFVLQIAIQVYQYLDRTKLGYLGNITEVAYYDLAQKFVRITLLITSTLGTAMMPRISNLIKEQKTIEVKHYIEKSLRFALTVSLPIMFGIIAVSKTFIPWFLGTDYMRVADLMIILSPIILIIPIGNIIGVQLMIPMGKELLVALCPITGAIMNIILNLILIPKIYATGAVISTIVAELVGTILALLLMRKYVNTVKTLINSYKSFIASISMFAIIYSLSNLNIHPLHLLLIQIITGLFSYIGILIILNDELTLSLVRKIKK
jgi:O-antigen/teichoic acid export membrane protein